MTVNVSKPVVNVREKLAELDKPSGVAGEAMLRAETPQEQFNLIGAGRRNLAINGAFDIWQRGNTFSNLNSSDIYSADRMHSVAYNSNFGAASGGQIERSFIYGTQIDGTNFTHALKISPSSTWRLAYLDQRVEDVTKFSDVHVTVSYYARANEPRIIIPTPRVNQVFGSGGSATVATYHQSPKTVELSTEWKRFSYTIHCPSIAGKTVAAGSYADFYIFQGTDLSNVGWLEIAGFQIEYGKIATPFEQRPYGEELALCQRYFVRRELSNYFSPAMSSGTNGRGLIQTSYSMRASPTYSANYDNIANIGFVSSSHFSGGGLDCASISFSEAGRSASNLDIAISTTFNTTPSDVAGFFFSADTDAYLDIDAEF